MSVQRRMNAWRLVSAAATFGAAVSLAFGAGAAIGVEEPAAPVVVTATGSDLFPRQLIEWQNDLLGSTEPVDLDFVPKGARDARTAFLEGKTDTAIVGVPFTAEELAGRPAGSPELISAPVHVATAMILLTPPYPDGLQQQVLVCDPDDPDEAHPERCIVRTPLPGPVRIPPENLAAMMLDLDIEDLNKWLHPKLLESLNAPDLNIGFGRRPLWVHRSEGSAVNHYLMEYARIAAPKVWNGAEETFPALKWEPVGEVIPLANKVSRKGLDAQVQAVANWTTNPKTGVLDTNSSAGILGAVPPSALEIAKEIYPRTTYERVEVRNGAGEWVAATPESISAAVAAGGDSPLYALDHTVPGGYPLTWVNHLYAPASGLDLVETNAIAALIRYLVTDGQTGAAGFGEGRLSPALVRAGLDAADELVEGNCVGDGRHVETSTDPGPMLPDLPVAKTIGPMSHCVADPPPTTTTTTTAAPTTAAATTTTVTSTTVSTTTTTTVAPAPSPRVTSAPTIRVTASAAPPPPPATEPPTTPAPVEVPPESVVEEPTTTVAPAALAAPPTVDTTPPTTDVARPRLRKALPLAAPSNGGRRLDRVVTLLLGAALFLLLRRFARTQIGALRLVYQTPAVVAG